jgi:type II restriction enzyme
MSVSLNEAKNALDNIINKARVHFYKPIQVAEILYHHRVFDDLTLADINTYRTASKRWRDVICKRFLGRITNSSSRYQDNLFEPNATPPEVLMLLGEENKNKSGIVEAYIYRKFIERYSQMTSGLAYCMKSDIENFELTEFIGQFQNNPGLKRSIDKIYEIVVYALFKVLIEELNVTVKVELDINKLDILQEFEDFTQKVLSINSQNPSFTANAKFYRVGVTNAADRGLDMWANYGPAIQIKHLSLNESLAEGIVSHITADRIVIVCRDSEEKTIISLLNQIGWKSRIQSIITQSHLEAWYEKALRGSFRHILGAKLIQVLIEEIKYEFPSSESNDLVSFMEDREYTLLSDPFWSV